MPTALLLCGVGTAVESARQKTWCRLEKELSESMQLPCFTAFTSPFIRKKLLADGVSVPSPEEAARQLTALGYDIFLQPMMLFDGEEYQKLACMAAQQKLPIGKPLFSDADTAKCLLEKLCADCPAEKDRRLILMLHGSKIPLPLEFLNDILLSLGRKDVSLCVLKEDPPFCFCESRILLVPLMLTAGHHVQKDIASELQPKLFEKGYSVETAIKGLMEYPWFLSAVSDLIQRNV